MNKKIKTLFISLSFFMFFLFSNTSLAFAEKIDSFETNIKINKNGTIDVEEIIDYDFGTGQKHGIFRDLIYKKTNIEGKKFILGVDVLGVINEKGSAYNFTTSKSGDYLKIKIGDAEKFVTGQKTYVIQYKVSGAITYFSDHDEIYWNLTGDEWEVPINSFKSSISLPEGTNENNTRFVCYTGARGSTSQDCKTAYIDGKVVVSMDKGLNPREGVTVSVSFPKDIVSVLEPKEDRSALLMGVFKVLITLVFIIWYIFLPIKLLIDWFKERKFVKTNQRIVTAWFDPPKKDDGSFYSPAQTGFILKSYFNHKELTATLIHLAQKGYLKIRQDSKKKFTFIKLEKDENALQDFEKTALELIFMNGKVEVSTDSFKKDTSSTEAILRSAKLTLFDKFISDGVEEDGLFEKKKTSETLKKSALIIFGAVTANIPIILIESILGFRSKKTLKGIEKYSEAKSLENFLKSQDEQLNFQSQNQMFFEKLLPYAVAFGVDKIWAKRFKDIEMTNPTWYEGNDVFNSVMIGNLASSVGSSVGRSFYTSSTSSSGFSSGSSGGGFSGGGGGGGGGGSW